MQVHPLKSNELHLIWGRNYKNLCNFPAFIPLIPRRTWAQSRTVKPPAEATGACSNRPELQQKSISPHNTNSLHCERSLGRESKLYLPNLRHDHNRPSDSRKQDSRKANTPNVQKREGHRHSDCGKSVGLKITLSFTCCKNTEADQVYILNKLFCKLLN